MQKKSQIQMLETIAVLYIFFVLFFIGFVFYTQVIKGSIEAQKDENFQLKAIEIAQRASSLPELQCSEDNIVSDNCIDLIKLKTASKVILDNYIYYYDRLLFSKIKVTRVYPIDPTDLPENNEWTLYNNPLDDFSNKLVTNIPISILDPVENEKYFGVMTVELYLK